jgi:hypothetical protein
MEVEKKKTRILLYSRLPTGTYHENLAIWKLFLKKSGEFGSLFFHEKSFINRLKSYFSSRNLIKFHHRKQHCYKCSESTCPFCKSWKPLRHVMCQVQAIVLVLLPIQKLWSPYYILAQIPHRHSLQGRMA